MKARIEKKLSKRLVQIHPSLYGRAWRDDDHSELAYEENSNVRHCLSVGGAWDSYTGDCNEAYTVWSDWKMNWCWHGPFEPYPDNHKSEGYPNTEGFRPTTPNLMGLAAECELAAVAAGGRR
jgi:hypothetical protein